MQSFWKPISAELITLVGKYDFQMINNAGSSTNGWLLDFVSVCSTLVILPLSVKEPVNVPKMLVISLDGFPCLGLMLTQEKLL